MASKYTLPKNSGPAPFMRTLIIWGLPLLAWAALIAGWLVFVPSGDEPEAPAAPTEEVAQPPAETPPAEPTSSSAEADPAARRETSAPSAEPDQPAAQTPAATTGGTYSAAPYDFAGAVSYIGLPKEAGCATGILVDPATRKVLWAKNAEKSVPIASMTKMMTMLLAEEAIAEGRIGRDTVIPVSVEAYKIGGSQVWLDPKESFPLGELLKAVAIKSANDAAYLVGEALGEGDIEAFVRKMNARAKALGMKHTTFYETHGLGDSHKRNNTASAHDMVLLGERLLDYPEAMRLAGTRMDTFREGKTELRNHNNLVFNRVNGVDGLKTGYTRASGYCVTFSCERGGRRLVGCVTGFKSAKDRDAFSTALLAWGYSR